MPYYTYRAVQPNGKVVSGTLEMLSEASLKSHLKSQGYIVLKIDEKKTSLTTQKISVKGEQLTLFTSQLAELLKASLPLDQSLEALEEQTSDPEMKALTSSIKEKIRRGASFSEVLGGYTTVFPPLFRACVEAGESIGSIGDAVARINTLMTSNLKLKQKLFSLLLYPILLFFLLIAAVLILSFFVLPALEGLFEGKTLPAFSTLIFGMSHFLQNYWLEGLIVLLGSVVFISYFLRKKIVREKISQQLLHVPIIGRFLLLSSMSRFSVTLAHLLQGGIPLVKALELAKESITNSALRQELQKIIDGLVHGEKFSSMFKRSKVFPPLMGRFAYLGEETGKLAELFLHIGTIYEEESSRNLERAVNLLQPALLLLMGGVIGTTILAILLPLSDFGSMINM